MAEGWIYVVYKKILCAYLYKSIFVILHYEFELMIVFECIDTEFSECCD
jgi:hypothetical protein